MVCTSYIGIRTDAMNAISQARVQGGGGPKGLPPPLEIKKQKKNKKKGHQRKF